MVSGPTEKGPVPLLQPGGMARGPVDHVSFVRFSSRTTSVYEPPAGRLDAPKVSEVDQVPFRLSSRYSDPPLVVKQAGLLAYSLVSCQLGLDAAEDASAGTATASAVTAAEARRAAARQCLNVMMLCSFQPDMT